MNLDPAELADAVRSSHGLHAASLRPVAAGVNTRNFTADTTTGDTVS